MIQGQVQFPLSGQCPKRSETASEVFFLSNSIEGHSDKVSFYGSLRLRANIT